VFWGFDRVLEWIKVSFRQTEKNGTLVSRRQ
jgi:hypothetical protein